LVVATVSIEAAEALRKRAARENVPVSGIVDDALRAFFGFNAGGGAHPAGGAPGLKVRT